MPKGQRGSTQPCRNDAADQHSGDLDPEVGNAVGVHEAQPRHGGHCQRCETDQQIGAHRAMGKQGEHADQDRQPELSTAKSNKSAQYGDGRTKKCGSYRPPDRIQVLGGDQSAINMVPLLYTRTSQERPRDATIQQDGRPYSMGFGNIPA